MMAKKKAVPSDLSQSVANAPEKKSPVKKSPKKPTVKKASSTTKSRSSTAQSDARAIAQLEACGVTYRGIKKLPDWSSGWLMITGARQNNLQSIDVPFPLSALTVVTGVSGSGKSSLVQEILYPVLARKFQRAQMRVGAYQQVIGAETLNKVISVDQQPLGQTPTSNPATYTGVFELIRELFSQLPEAKARGFSPRRFSFNVPGGRCEKCEGAGQRKIEMHFLSDVWVTCDACNGRRYEADTLSVLYQGQSIADVLDMPIRRALQLFSKVPPIARILKMLCDVGLGYLSLGQPAPTLSGGEAQRVKLAAELARPDTGRTLYVLDEPTTGLHFEDLRKLLDVIHRLVDLGNTAVIIEHNLDMIKSADWVVELGPEAGTQGGYLVYAGTPERMVEYEQLRQTLSPEKRKEWPKSWTADALAPVLANDPYEERPVFNAKAYQEELARVEKFDLEEEIKQSLPKPWTTEGRFWHTVSRVTASQTPCKWDGRILSETVDRIENSGLFRETNWGEKSYVTIQPKAGFSGWFFWAQTDEEWLLKIRFRYPRAFFRKEEMIQRVRLVPLSERDDIPLFGTRNRVQTLYDGPYTEIEMRVYDYDEINQPAYWELLDALLNAVRWSSGTSTPGENPEGTFGRQWHLTPEHCYGESDRPTWEIALLEKILNLIEKSNPETDADWSQRLTVPFRKNRDGDSWVRVYTKNALHIGVEISFPSGKLPKEDAATIGFEPEFPDHNDQDTVFLHFRNSDDLDEDAFVQLLTRSLKSDNE